MSMQHTLSCQYDIDIGGAGSLFQWFMVPPSISYNINGGSINVTVVLYPS